MTPEVKVHRKRRGMWVIWALAAWVAVALVFTGLRYCLYHEQGEYVQESPLVLPGSYYILKGSLSDEDLTWKQPNGFGLYRVEVENTGSTGCTVLVQYSLTREPHVIFVPAGERRDYLVGWSWSWPYHRIEVAAPEGEPQGTIKVLVALDLPEDAL